MKVTKHLRIHGLVQGVNYREAMRLEAERLGVTGWVRNRHDGTVEAVVHGSAEAVHAIMNWAHKGPRHARVTQMDVNDADGSYDMFERRPSD